MIAGTDKQFLAMIGENERSPDGFYRVSSEEIWPDIDPYLMSRTQLDAQIKAGIKLHEKYFPTGNGFGLFEAVVVVASMAAVAYFTAGTAVAAGGAGQAAASGAAASSAGATANASAALAATGPGGGAWAAGSATATGAGATSAASAASFASKTMQVAQTGAKYVKKIGGIAKAAGNNDADKMIRAADIVESSGNVKEVGSKVFEQYIKERGMEMNEDARKALRARMAKEQGSYAAWLRREGKKLQEQNPDVQTSGQNSLMRWLPIATPFVLLMLAGR